MSDAERTTAGIRRTVGQVAVRDAPANLTVDRAALRRQDKLKYAVVPVEWLRAVAPIDTADRPSAKSLPADMIDALEEMIQAAKSDRELSVNEELALRAAAWPDETVAF